MTRCLFLLMSVLACLLLAAPAWAQERITAYDSTVDIRTDGSLDVTEHITVRAEGGQIRRGIYRDFPTRYKDRYGNGVVADFQMLSVERDGEPEPWFTEPMDNGVRVNTGNDDFLKVPATYVYTLRFRTTRQLGFFDGHDELYWNAIGTGWAFPIEAATVEVRLPAAVPVAQMGAEGYTGVQGQKGHDYRAELPSPGMARWVLTRPLMPREGLTTVLTFPKGLVTPPSQAARALWFLNDNRGVLVILLGWVVLLVFCIRRWHQVGRDPPPGVIIARYDPPPGQTPAGLRFMTDMAYDTRCFSSDLLALGVAGCVRIRSDPKLLQKDVWTLEKIAPAPADLDPTQRALFDALFPSGKTELELRNTNAATVSGAQAKHRAALDKRFQPELFKLNGGSTTIAVLIGIATGIVAFWLADGVGVIAMSVLLFLMFPAVLLFAWLVRAPTPAGRKLLDEIEGLKLYLGVAERDELKAMRGPDQPPALDAARYETLLPYAVALEVEDAWTKKFTLAAGAAAAAAASAGFAWYHGSKPGDLANLTRAVGSGLSSRIASSSSPPGSSSGSGGGGSSGGGGGGGGGGGR